jgi:pantoate--beta-alanine ligase
VKVVKTVEEVRSQVSGARASGSRIGLVPTMGGLHRGHFSLVDRAVSQCDFVVVSIFVNPTQFGPGEDLEEYPRTLESDIAGCERSGASLVFVPPVEEIYPDWPEAGLTTVTVGGLTETMCGASRPGHFDGVCTVVGILFNIVRPDAAYFGDKDYQQSLVIRRMVRDLKMGVDIEVCPTIREQDGLACSSRNEYLDAEQRDQAPVLYASLSEAAQMIQRDHPGAGKVIEFLREKIESGAPAGRIGYIEVLDPESLAPVETTDCPVLVAIAVAFGRARLIDHVVVG